MSATVKQSAAAQVAAAASANGWECISSRRASNGARTILLSRGIQRLRIRYSNRGGVTGVAGQRTAPVVGANKLGQVLEVLAS